MARAYHKLPPEFLQFGACWGDQVAIAGGTREAAPDAAGTSTTGGGILPTSEFLQLPRQLLDLRHGQREFLFLLIEQGPDAVQIRGYEWKNGRGIMRMK